MVAVQDCSFEFKIATFVRTCGSIRGRALTMLVSFQTAMPILLALLAILTAWLLVERPMRCRVATVFMTEVATARPLQLGQSLHRIPVGLVHLCEARRGSPNVPPGARCGAVPPYESQLL